MFKNDVTVEEVAEWFSVDVQQLGKAKILFAYYDKGDYEGSAFVLFKQGRKLYEVYGSHCSCYGLEDQWSPEETNAEALLHRVDNGYVPGGLNEELRIVLQGLTKPRKKAGG